MSERWAHCDPCSRWFDLDRPARTVDEPRCRPVCQTPARHAAHLDTMTQGAN